MKKGLFILLSLITINGLNAQKTYNLLNPTTYSDPSLNPAVLSSYATYTLNETELSRIMQDSPESVRIPIVTADGQILEASMIKRQIFADGFKVRTPDGEHRPDNLGLHYGGKLSGDPNSMAAFSFFDTHFIGLITNSKGNFNIVYLYGTDKQPSKKYVVYNDFDLLLDNPFSCGLERLPEVKKTQMMNQGIQKSGSECKPIKQYYECDYKMYQNNGSNVTTTTNFTTAMFNVVSQLYNNEQITMQISEIYVWTSNDSYPFSSSDLALFAFSDAVQDNFNGDLAHLLSQRPANNGGIAWLDVLCQQYSAQYSYGRTAYSNINNSYQNLPNWSWTINCVTHETGHNLGSNHTHWCGWQLSPGVFGSIDSCYTTEPNNGNTCYQGPNINRVGTIMSYCHLGAGVNLSLGFGPLPGNVIRTSVEGASCLASSGPPAPTITGDNSICSGDNLVLTASGTGGTVSWTGPGGFTSSQSTITINGVTSANAGTYTATVSGSGCSSSTNSNVVVYPLPPTPTVSQNGNTLSCTPTTASFVFTWYNQAGQIVDNTDSPTFNPTTEGNYYVVIQNGNGCKRQSVLFDFKFNTTSLDESYISDQIRLWPNPVGLDLMVDIGGGIGSLQSYKIMDLSGKVLSVGRIQGMQMKLDMSGVSNGMYLLVLEGTGGRFSRKVLVAR